MKWYIVLSHFYCFRIYFHYLQVKILQCFYSHFKRYLFVKLLLIVLSVLFNYVVNIIFPSVDTSVHMVLSHWTEMGAILHAYTSPQWELIAVLLLSMPISFHSHMGAHICEVCSQTELMLHRLTYTNMPYSYMTSIQICFTVTWH